VGKKKPSPDGGEGEVECVVRGGLEPPAFRFQLDSGGRGTGPHSRRLGLPTGIWGHWCWLLRSRMRFVRPIFVSIMTIG
jgi:hypothetical protein